MGHVFIFGFYLSISYQLHDLHYIRSARHTGERRYPAGAWLRNECEVPKTCAISIKTMLPLR